MKLLITGGFGYLGGRLAQYLALSPSYEVCLASRRKIESPSWLATAETMPINWDSEQELIRNCKGFDAIIHLAGMNAQACAEDPSAAMKINGGVTDRLLKAAVWQGIKRFVYVSTVHVYGNPLIGSITEQTPAVGSHPYATSNLLGERSVVAAHKRGDIEGIVIRLSNAFGAPAHKDVECWMLLVNDLCRQAVINQQMVLRSTGLQRRDFVPLEDVCRAIAHLLELPASEFVSGLFNVGGAWAPTTWEMACLLAERCEATLGFSPQLIRATPKVGETSASLDYKVDALLQTGFQPSSKRVEEIDRLIRFCKTSFSYAN